MKTPHVEDDFRRSKPFGWILGGRSKPRYANRRNQGATAPMSELGQKQTLGEPNRMSALPPKADIRVTRRHVFGPCVDGSGLARRIFTLQHWSEQPCVRPVCAVLMTAGHNALRGSGPGQ